MSCGDDSRKKMEKKSKGPFLQSQFIWASEKWKEKRHWLVILQSSEFII